MKLISAAASALALSLAAGAASAQDLDIAFNVAATTDYVFRGISQTDEEAAIQGGVDATYGSFYAGAWASNVDFFDSTDAEIDAYAGYRTELSGFAVDVGAIGYFYVDQPDGADYDYVEFKAAASRAIGPVTAGVAVYYSPDFSGTIDEATYAELNGLYEFAPKWTVSGAVGKQWFDGGGADDYTTWNVGVSYALTDNIVLDGRYHDSDIDNTLADDRAVASIKYLF